MKVDQRVSKVNKCVKIIPTQHNRQRTVSIRKPHTNIRTNLIHSSRTYYFDLGFTDNSSHE